MWNFRILNRSEVVIDPEHGGNGQCCAQNHRGRGRHNEIPFARFLSHVASEEAHPTRATRQLFPDSGNVNDADLNLEPSLGMVLIRATKPLTPANAKCQKDDCGHEDGDHSGCGDLSGLQEQ